MSSLRLALKQSLKETGHLAPKEKKRKGSSASSLHHLRNSNSNGSAAMPLRRKRDRQAGKRGRPRKHQSRNSGPDGEGSSMNSPYSDDDDDEFSERDFSSENEFSHESDGDESHEEEHEEDEEEYEEDESQHAEDEDEVDESTASKASEKIQADEEEDGEDEDGIPADAENGRDYIVENTDNGGDHPKKVKKSIKSSTRSKLADSSSDDDYRRQKKLKRQLKHSAANKIQSEWKKRKEQGSPVATAQDEGSQPQRQSSQADTTPPETFKRNDSEKAYRSQSPNESESAGAKISETRKKKRRDDDNQTTSKSSGKSKTVLPPAANVLEWSRSLSEKKSREHITSGLRVKVRFATKVKRDGKIIKKKKWYGGLVSAVSKKGSKIRIQYDDGTSEVSKFPDKDVVVDEEFNGQHLTNADKFLPPPPKPVAGIEEVVTKETSEAGGAKESIPVPTTDKQPEESKESIEISQPLATEFEEAKDLDTENARKPSIPSSFVGGCVKETILSEKEDERGFASEIFSANNLDKVTEPTVRPSRNDAKLQAHVEEPTAMARVESTKESEFQQSIDTVPDFEMETSKVDANNLESAISNDQKSNSEKVAYEMSDETHIETIGVPNDHNISPETHPTQEKAVHVATTSGTQVETVGGVATEEKIAKQTAGENSAHDEKAYGDTPTGVAIEQETARASLVKSKLPKQENALKPSLIIRIPNVKADNRKAPPEQLRDDETSDETEETSDEEIDSLPLTMKADDLTTKPEKVEQQLPKSSRKRSSSDTSTVSEGPPQPRKRIHLLRAELFEAISDVQNDVIAEGVSQSKQKLEAKTVANEFKANQALALERHVDTSDRTVDDASHGSALHEPGEKLAFGEDVANIDCKQLSVAPVKMKRKRDSSDRSLSPKFPKPRNPRRSPISNGIQRTDSPEPMSSEPKVTISMSKPVSKVMKLAPKAVSIGSSDHSEVGESSVSNRRSVILTGSRNSAFERKQPSVSQINEGNDSSAIQASVVQKPAQDIIPGSEGKAVSPKLRDRKAPQDASSNAARSGRRAAQQAKERINSKHDFPGPESAKKKKKKRKKEGKDSDEEESETSEDDRQWVQCDNCGKWRILPSTVKASTLPKHWYCDMNVYDPKRNSCAAPEQTPRQVLKERKRAKKRARQRMEQNELQAIPEEPRNSEAVQSVAVIRPHSPTDDISRDLSVSVEPSQGQGKQRRASPASEISQDHHSALSDSGSDTRRGEKKVPHPKKGKPSQEASEVVASSISEPPVIREPKEKHARRRGRPARDSNKEPDRASCSSARTTSQEKKEEGDNVEWVQCEKCDKWRKLPPHISADDLPDVWYCAMNTWNPKSASCESPEDKADALHQDVGKVGGTVPTGNPGKFSYRSLIFGTGRKHNRPMSERTRAAESLFAKPVEDVENSYPVVMYAKSSAFSPRTSNFAKANAPEQRTISVFDVMSNSALWAELRGITGPGFNVMSSDVQNHIYSYDTLPETYKMSMRELVLHSLGGGTLTGDEVVFKAQNGSWENAPPAWLPLRAHCTEDIIVHTLLELVKEGIIEMTCNRESDRPLYEWVPKYRLVRARRDSATEEAMKASKCMKISKPWKQREESNSHWISGSTAFA